MSYITKLHTRRNLNHPPSFSHEIETFYLFLLNEATVSPNKSASSLYPATSVRPSVVLWYSPISQPYGYEKSNQSRNDVLSITLTSCLCTIRKGTGAIQMKPHAPLKKCCSSLHTSYSHPALHESYRTSSQCFTNEKLKGILVTSWHIIIMLSLCTTVLQRK